MNLKPLRGLVAATHTPFDEGGELNLAVVEHQAEHLLQNGIQSVFIGGSTGESASLSLSERLALATRWMEVARDSELEVIVHVGSNCLRDAAELARQAGQLKARAISMVVPSYFKPATLDTLVACCAQVAREAPETPFYYYDIPALTGVKFPMPEFMQRAAQTIPNFAGLKYTNSDLGEYQLCQQMAGTTKQVFWGVDEFYLAALPFGAQGAIGSTYNFAPQLGQRIERSFAAGDLENARAAQLQVVQLVGTLAPYGYLAAAKCVMKMLGVNVGPVRLPLASLSPEQQVALRHDLENLGFFSWIQK